MKQLESGFKGIIKWNKYQSQLTEEVLNRHLDYLIDPRLQGVNKLFVLFLESITNREAHTGYFLPKVDIKDYDWWKKVFWPASKKWFNNIW